VKNEEPGVKEKIKKNIFCVALCAMLFALCGSVGAQQQAKMARIGWLRTNGSGSSLDLFTRQLREVGYIEGKNIAFEHRSAKGKLDRLPALAEELVRLKVDLLLTSSTTSVQALKNATTTIPIVFLFVSDPVGAGLVDSLPHPGGNITGFTNISPVLSGKRLELLKETIPKLSRVAVLWNPRAESSTQQWKESQLAARELGLQLHSMEVGSADKYEGAFKEALKARSAALTVTQETLASFNQKRIADLAMTHRLPAIYPRGDYASSGGMMSYGPDRTEPYRRGALMVDKILKGTKPADLPVEQPMKFELVINLKTAKRIGLTIPPNVLVRADRVIK
jgi:ABC-type uncharacterized transport system substrate-binding protein